MRSHYRIWVCPERGCAVIGSKQTRCPKHDLLFCKVTVKVERPPKRQRDLGDALADIHKAFS